MPAAQTRHSTSAIKADLQQSRWIAPHCGCVSFCSKTPHTGVYGAATCVHTQHKPYAFTLYVECEQLHSSTTTTLLNKSAQAGAVVSANRNTARQTGVTHKPHVLKCCCLSQAQCTCELSGNATQKPYIWCDAKANATATHKHKWRAAMWPGPKGLKGPQLGGKRQTKTPNRVEQYTHTLRTWHSACAWW